MAELTTASSGYATGSIDTWSNVHDDPGGDEYRAAHPNGLGSAIVQIETVLGDGTSLKGSKTDLATRLAVQMSAAGIINPIGSIQMYGGASSPTGFLLCDGTAVDRTTYVDLFSVIGTSYGTGNGSTTFNVPDMRSRSPIGVGSGGTGSGASGTGLPTGGLSLTTVARGTWKGEENHTLTTAELASHTHTDAGHAHAQQADTALVEGGASWAGAGSSLGVGGTTGTTAVSLSNTGSGVAHNTMQPVLGVQFIIKY